jgi:PilZ domain
MEDGGTAVAAAELTGEAAEQRGEQRYPVAWDAEIFVPERTAMFRGQMVNLSPSGCYVQTVAWVRLPPTTVVELVFTLDGRMIRLHAEARFAQSRTGVGLRFLPLEEEIRWRLDKVLAGLRTAAVEKAEPHPAAGAGGVGVAKVAAGPAEA